MNNSNLEDIILKTIDIVASKKVASAKYDKTIQATVVSCEDATIGKYKVQYQDGFWYAYSNNTDVTYPSGSNVYILVPQGNMSNEKTILGTTKKLGLNYVNVTETVEKYTPIGQNIIENDDKYELCSYKNEVKILYNYELNNNLINLDEDAVKQYFINSDFISISMSIRTDLNIEQQYQGNYGILVGLDFIDNATGSLITRYYTIDVDAMTGNPYRYNFDTKQFAVFEIDKNNFIRVNTIQLFVNNFPIQKDDQPSDIFISNLEISGAAQLSMDDLNSCALVLTTPRGYIFNKNSLATDTRTIEAQMRVKGKVVDTAIQQVDFYWFVENLTINSKSSRYNKYGGQGWYCLNPYNIVKAQSTQGNETTPAVYSFLPGQSSFSIAKADTYVRKTKYKCVAIYDNNIFSKQITIINNDATYQVFIQSDKGTEFYYDIGNPTLTCHCQSYNNVTEEWEDVNLSNLDFVWAKNNNNNTFESLPETENYNLDQIKLTTIYNAIISYLDAEYLLYKENFDYEKLLPSDADIASISNISQRERVRSIRNIIYQQGIQQVDDIIDLFLDYGIGLESNLTVEQITFGTQMFENYPSIQSVINNFDYIQRVNKNKIEGLNVKAITLFSVFRCSVFNRSTNKLIGTASITITNNLNGNNMYNLIINNGTQVFKYNTHGISPASKQNKIPMQIPTLSFDVYDTNGEKIDSEIIRHCEIEWIIPTVNTLLEVSDNYSGGIPDSSLTHISYKNLMSFAYKIKQRYDFSKTENNIQLKVLYNGINLVASTNFTFTKDGAAGTNGTDFVCKVIPNVVYGDIPVYPTVYYRSGTPTFNWNPANQNQLFKAQLWHNGVEPIFEGIDSAYSSENKQVTVIKWEVLRNKYFTSRMDNTHFNVLHDGTKWIMSFNPEEFIYTKTTYEDWMPADIIKVTLSYDGITHYGFLPVITCRVFDPLYQVNLKPYSGFNEVLYSSSGTQPDYDNHAPFEILVKQNLGNSQWEDLSNKTSDEYRLNYDWYFMGETQYRNSSNQWVKDYGFLNDEDTIPKRWLMPSNLIVDLKRNQYAIKPAEVFDGECVTTGIACHVYRDSDNKNIAWIHIPIHMLRNRYFNSALNGWDGNTIDLGSNGGTILAPQVGAGVKEQDNSFTGIFMGRSKDPSQSVDSATGGAWDSELKPDQQVGLFGYHQGSRTIFLDAKTGKAVFGQKNKAQIILDPSSNAAEIRSGNYSETNKTGMKIDLTKPEIKYGSGHFQVDENGNITIQGNGAIGGWMLGWYSIYHTASQTGMFSVSDVNATGASKKTVYVPSSGSYSSVTKAVAFKAGGSNFFVSHDGYLRAQEATIGSGSSPIFIGRSDSTNSAIFSGTKTAKDISKSGFYLGVDGLGIGYASTETLDDNTTKTISNFQVDSNGTFYAKQGYIGNSNLRWNISSGSINYQRPTIDNLDKAKGVYIGKDGISIGRRTENGSYVAGFKVDDTGKLYARNAYLSGQINATSGSIANWSIEGDFIYAVNDSKYTLLHSTGTYAFAVGAPSFANVSKSAFYVKHNGEMYAGENTEINGFHFATTTVGNTVFQRFYVKNYDNTYNIFGNGGDQTGTNRVCFAIGASSLSTYYSETGSPSKLVITTEGALKTESYIYTKKYIRSSYCGLDADGRIWITSGGYDTYNTNIFKAVPTQRNSDVFCDVTIKGDLNINGAIQSGSITTTNVSASNDLYGFYLKTSTAWAFTTGSDVLMNTSTGQIAKSKSSKRYKNFIKYAEDESVKQLLNVKPLYFTYKENAVLDNDFKPQFGLFAEDVAEAFPQAAVYNEENQVEDWSSRVMIPALLKLIQIQEKRIAQLQEVIYGQSKFKN